MVHCALDHRRDLRRRTRDQLRIDRHRLLVHVPVNQNPTPTVSNVVLGEQVLIEGPEMCRVRSDRARAGAPDELLTGGERRVGDRGGERPAFGGEYRRRT